MFAVVHLADSTEAPNSRRTAASIAQHQRAQSLVKQKHYPVALKLLNESLSLNPDDQDTASLLSKGLSEYVDFLLKQGRALV